MAEIAAGAIAAEQVIATGLEAGAAVAVAKPSQPLAGVLSQIATASAGDDGLSLARSHHSITVIGNNAYIFGGNKADGRLCHNEIHAISLHLDNDQAGDSEYACYPAVPSGAGAPQPRSDHAACALGNTLILHGGQGDSGTSLDEEPCLWQWSPKSREWIAITAVGVSPGPRYNHQIFSDDEKGLLILHGGLENGRPATDTWLFDITTRTWNELPSAPATSLSAQYVVGTLYCISDSSIQSINIRSIEDEAVTPQWSTVNFTSGPTPREGAGLIPVSTGLGRHYLVYLLGSRKQAQVTPDYSDTHYRPFFSDIWSVQLPSETFSAASVKDAVRDLLPHTTSGAYSWCGIELAPAEATSAEGKAHPGPRAFFAADTCLGGRGVLFWGGFDAKGETVGDGWLLKVS